MASLDFQFGIWSGRLAFMVLKHENQAFGPMTSYPGN